MLVAPFVSPLGTFAVNYKLKWQSRGEKNKTLLKSHISLSTDFHFHVWLMKNYLASDEQRTILQK